MKPTFISKCNHILRCLLSVFCSISYKKKTGLLLSGLIKHICVQAIVNTKSLQRSPAVGDFYETGIEIWAGFGPVWQLLRPVFSCFHGQKKFLKTFQTVKTILAQNEVKKIIFFFLKSQKKKFRLRHIFNCVLLYQRPLTAGLLYNDFELKQT